MLKKVLIAATVITGAALATTPGQASEWGCEVLLCSMSTNPTWQGVPSCIPPMTKLMNAMHGWFFSWPTCSEAKATRPRRSNYEPCPAGQASIALSDLSPGCYDASSQKASFAIPRERPWYFDMTDEDGTKTRYWFSLSR